MSHNPSGLTAPAGAPETARRWPRTRSWLGHRWPTALGVALTAFMALGTIDHTKIAPVVTASGFVYLGSAALQRRAAAWPMFVLSFVVVGIGVAVPGIAASWSSWVMLAVAAGLTAYALIRGALPRPPWGVPLQAAAMLVLAATAITAVSVEARWAGVLVAAGLLAHAAWDAYHHRIRCVVARSMAEFCAVLDTLLAIAVLAVTVTG